MTIKKLTPDEFIKKAKVKRDCLRPLIRRAIAAGDMEQAETYARQLARIEKILNERGVW